MFITAKNNTIKVMFFRALDQGPEHFFLIMSYRAQFELMGPGVTFFYRGIKLN